jgi:hypothetical protein
MASVYNSANDTIVPGIDSHGPRVVNFADILKYNFIPLAPTLSTVLDVVSEATGNPTEIEFAVDLTPDAEGKASFYLLQIKPLVGSGAGYNIEKENIDREHLLLETNKSMGNGVIDNITDVIYIEPGMFENSHTLEMAAEIEEMNDTMLKEDRRYVLIGPGRWGTRDRYLGIPVVWPQISNARVIVEVGLPGFHVDASLGSHFFHNVTSMQVGYFCINHNTEQGQINWDKLTGQPELASGRFFRHVRFQKPLLIRMDGRKGYAVITV